MMRLSRAETAGNRTHHMTDNADARGSTARAIVTAFENAQHTGRDTSLELSSLQWTLIVYGGGEAFVLHLPNGEACTTMSAGTASSRARACASSSHAARVCARWGCCACLGLCLATAVCSC